MYKFCDSPFSTVHVYQNGDVGLCICGAWHTKGIIGNLNTHSLAELFSSKWIEDFRNTIYDQSFKYCSKERCSKLWNLDTIDSFDHINRHPQLPTTVYLQDIDRNCNLTCESCRLSTQYAKEVNPAAQNILNKLIDAYQDYPETVMLCGDGSGDVFASMAYKEFLHNPRLPKCFKLCINTNGTFLTKNLDLLEKLRDQFGSLAICFDAATPETYKQVRGAKFELIVEGARAARQLGIPVTASFVVQRKNYHEILAYRDLMEDIGVSFANLQKINRWEHMSGLWWRQNRIENNSDIDYDWLIPALKDFRDTAMPFGVSIDGALQTLIEKHGAPTVN